MDILSESEIQESTPTQKYSELIDRECLRTAQQENQQTEAEVAQKNKIKQKKKKLLKQLHHH
jgi:hypothetical protein